MDNNDSLKKENASFLINSFLPYISRRASRFKTAGMLKEDLIQEGLIGLLDAIEGFDENKGSSFEAYAVTCINNRIYSVLRDSTRKKNIPLNEYLSLSDESESYPGLPFAPSPEELVVWREEINRIYSMIKDKLSVAEKKVLSLYLQGYSYTAIAELLSIPVKSVDNALQRARKKLK